MTDVNSRNEYSLYAVAVDRSDLKAYYKQHNKPGFSLEKFIEERLTEKKQNAKQGDAVLSMYTEAYALKDSDVIHFMKALRAELALQQGLDGISTKKEEKYNELDKDIEGRIFERKLKVISQSRAQAQLEGSTILESLHEKYPLVKTDGANVVTKLDKAFPDVSANGVKSEYKQFIEKHHDKITDFINKDPALKARLDEASKVPEVEKNEVDQASKNMQQKLDKISAKTTAFGLGDNNRVDINNTVDLQAKIKGLILASDAPAKENIANNKLLNDGGKIGAYTLAALKTAAPEIYREMMDAHPQKKLIDKLSINSNGVLVDENGKALNAGAAGKVYNSLRSSESQATLLASANNAIETLHDASTTPAQIKVAQVSVDQKAIDAIYKEAATNLYESSASKLKIELTEKTFGRTKEIAASALTFIDVEAVTKFRAELAKNVAKGVYNSSDGFNTHIERVLEDRVNQLELSIKVDGGTANKEFKISAESLGIKPVKLDDFAASRNELKPTSTPVEAGANNDMARK